MDDTNNAADPAVGAQPVMSALQVAADIAQAADVALTATAQTATTPNAPAVPALPTKAEIDTWIMDAAAAAVMALPQPAQVLPAVEKSVAADLKPYENPKALGAAAAFIGAIVALHFKVSVPAGAEQEIASGLSAAFTIIGALLTDLPARFGVKKA